MRKTKTSILSDYAREYTIARIIGNNTIEIYHADGSRVIRLHHTDIVTIHADGSQTLNSGGWRTATTKERINEHSSARIAQKAGVWYIVNKSGDHLGIFADGVRVDRFGVPIEGAGTAFDS